ncbi:hypothetical protein E4J49_18605 [Vibrio parahaemolyticus]|nr:hypothetical protein [Vibrio parahaemolyticus]EGQ9116745.1 hypothetical protein [Vibrio parahaemolyticus]EGQ9132070.1 hypothetical protein [Vibrio parahaemolyticus]EGQ9161544.1 hypothetical protein [Vibrio parahaemolyticus]EGQ9453758.1 hypothetical protein [Vibrio parahaemolyticus]
MDSVSSFMFFLERHRDKSWTYHADFLTIEPRYGSHCLSPESFMKWKNVTFLIFIDGYNVRLIESL